MKYNLCFSSFVFGNYQKYIPFYIYSIYKTYPESFTKIVIEEKLELSIAETLKYIKQNTNYEFEVLELKTSFSDYERFKMKGSGAKTMMRWLFDSSYFKDCNYVYIGDVDIIFLAEKISLLDLHIAQMKEIAAPFSNKVRVDKSEKLTTRLTGLHFFKKDEYFQEIDPIIKNLLNDELYLTSFVKGLERNEDFLYKLNMKAFNFNPELVSNMQRPWHGLHLGITRGNKNINIKTIEENSSLSLIEIKSQLLSFHDDKVFQKIMQNVFVMEYYVILKHLQIQTPFLWRLKAVNYDWQIVKKYLKNKIKSSLSV